MVAEIEEALSEADPENADTYAANAASVSEKLDALVAEITPQLEPYKGKGFIVFHDAYQYFENRFGVSAVGSITVSPEVLPGAERIAEIQAKLKDQQASCVFAEPQFEPKLVATVIEGTDAKSGVIDPHGAAIDAGADHYFETSRAMATSIQTCLSD